MSRFRWTLLFAGSIVCCLAGCGDETLAPPVDPFAGLLTDEELVTAPDSTAPPVDAAQEAWILDNSLLIRSLTSEYYADLQFLKPILEGRSLVQLGESGHGVAEFSAVKTRLIRFLHEELGFDVIAFESSIFECYEANRTSADLLPLELMQHSIFGVWQSEEVLDLFEYIKETHETGRPLALAGFDVQISSIRGVRSRPRFFRQVTSPIDSLFGFLLGTADSLLIEQATFSFQMLRAFLSSMGDFYVALYEDVVAFLDVHADSLVDTHAVDPSAVLIARQTAWSMIQYIEEIESMDNFHESIFVRDRGMAENVRFLVEELHAGKKIILWAHNFHIRHQHKDVLFSEYGRETMGTWIAEDYRPSLYTVGLYMYRGRAAQNDGQVYDIQPASPGSIEAIFYRVRKMYVFVDMLRQIRVEGNAWMFERTLAKTWGWNDLRMVPRDQYDAIVFIDTVNPPAYTRKPGLDSATPEPCDVVVGLDPPPILEAAAP
ncbi:MAG: erythromycin esterase family protein [Candidatus Krumholzibacteriia bacterium]